MVRANNRSTIEGQQPLSADSSVQTDVHPLEVGKAIEREMKGGEVHAYVIMAAARDYFRIAVMQRGIDVALILFSPDGKKIAEVDSPNGNMGPESVNVITNAAGAYRLEVRSLEGKAAGGSYTARVEELRAATAEDSRRAARQAEVTEAKRLADQAVKFSREGLNAQALSLADRSLSILEKALGPNHPNVAISLNILAQLYHNRTDYARAEQLYGRAISILEKALGPDHPEVARPLNNLAFLYDTKGDYAYAEPLYVRALSILEKAHGPDHPNVGWLLNNVAALSHKKGDYAHAEPLYLRALSILEKALGPNHPNVANSLNTLAGLYSDKGDYARAEPLFQRALAIYEKALGPETSSVGAQLSSLAAIYQAKGDYARAEPLFQRALAIYEKVFGPEHPDVADLLNHLAGLYLSMNESPKAIQFRSRAAEVSERSLLLVLSTGSERQKLAYLATHSAETSAIVSLHTHSAPSDRQALDLALTTVLRRKGRALDTMADQVAGLRRRLDPQDSELFDQLSAAQTRLSTLILSGSNKTQSQEERRAEVSRLEVLVDRLQDAVAKRNAEFRMQVQPVTIEQVRQAIPEGAALVEFLSYKPYNQKAKRLADLFGPARYVAYVLRREGEPFWVDLGEAEGIDASASRLIVAMKCPQASSIVKKCPSVTQVKQVARALDEQLMHPVRRLLGKTHQVFLSPDGSLNLVPFAALIDEKGKYLVETYSLTYLTSGRDLLRLQLSSKSKQPPLIVADPLFGAVQEMSNVSNASSEESSRRSSDMSRMHFGRLKGTADEAKALATVLPEAKLLTQAQATEVALKQVSSPRILHIATHGFFLPDEQQAATSDSRGVGLSINNNTARVALSVDNPLLRSGLALAGANSLQGVGGEDGILTALEATNLDLWGTKLVVLSACESGVGEIKTGEGVYGLRRSLVLAGSESQVMSLWQVSDEATRDLMIAYYNRLAAGEGRTEALRQVQLKMLKGVNLARWERQRGLIGRLGSKKRTADRRHPYYWAAFIQSGDWREM